MALSNPPSPKVNVLGGFTFIQVWYMFFLEIVREVNTIDGGSP